MGYATESVKNLYEHVINNDMTNRLILITGLFLISFSIYGQDYDQVDVFIGHKAPYWQITVLDLSHQNLREIHYEANNQEIEILILDNNKIEKLPNWISNLKNLKTLSLKNNNLLELNPFLSRCENLEQLYLSGNKKLNDLPALTQNINLKIIDVIGTGITEVPGWVEMSDNIYYFKYSPGLNKHAP